MEKEVYSKYKNDIPATFGRRLESSVIDGLLLIILSFVLIISGIEILKVVPAYQTWMNNLNEERIACYKIEEEAKLYEFYDNENQEYNNLVEPEQTFEDYCLRQILLVYENDEQNFLSLINHNEILNPKGLSTASYETDNLAYFYTSYVPKYNDYDGKNNDLFDMGGRTPKEFYYYILNENAVDTSFYILDIVNYTLPRLKTEFAANLYRYLFLNEEGLQVGLTSYNLLAKNYQNIWNLAVDRVVSSSRYVTHYESYKTNYSYCTYGVDLVCLLSYLISYLLVYCLPLLLFKESASFGKFFMKLKPMVLKDEKNPTFINYLLKYLVSFFSMMPVLIISCFFAGGLNTGWMYPLFEIGGIGFSLFNLTAIMLVLPIVSVIVMLVRNNKQSLSDLAGGLIFVDGRYHVDPSKMTDEKLLEIEKGYVNKSKDEGQINSYFDSSCFDNSERDKKD